MLLVIDRIPTFYGRLHRGWRGAQRANPTVALGLVALVLLLLFVPRGQAQPIVRSLPLSAIDVASLPGNDTLLVLTYDASEGAALRLIEPTSGAEINSMPLPGVPSRFAREGYGSGLAVAEDGSTAYVARSDSGLVIQVDLGSWTVAGSIEIEQPGTLTLARGLAVQPGRPDVLVASLHQPYRSPPYEGLVVYENGEPRPDMLPDHSGPYVLSFGSSDELLYGIGGLSGSTPLLYSVGIDLQGAHLLDTHGVLQEVFTSDFIYFDGLLVTNKGVVIREGTYEHIGTLPDMGFGTPKVKGLLGGEISNLVYFLSQNTIRAHWLDDLSSAARLEFSEALSLSERARHASVVRWGSDGIAVAAGDALVLVQSPLFSTDFVTLVAQESFTFPPADSPVPGHVWIHNRGNAAVSVDTLSVEGPFEVEANATVIAPRDSMDVAITVTASDEGAYSGVLTAATAQSDAVVSRVQVSLFATVTTPLSENPETHSFYLNTPAPHPVKTTANVVYGVDEPGRLRLELFDLTGRRVAVIVDREHTPGAYTAEIDVRQRPTATYICRLASGQRTVARKLVVTR